MAAFYPETIETMRVALYQACAALQPVQQTELKLAILAERILSAAAQGERDPRKLRIARSIFHVQHKPTRPDPNLVKPSGQSPASR